MFTRGNDDGHKPKPGLPTGRRQPGKIEGLDKVAGRTIGAEGLPIVMGAAAKRREIAARKNESITRNGGRAGHAVRKPDRPQRDHQDDGEAEAAELVAQDGRHGVMIDTTGVAVQSTMSHAATCRGGSDARITKTVSRSDM